MPLNIPQAYRLLLADPSTPIQINRTPAAPITVPNPSPITDSFPRRSESTTTEKLRAPLGPSDFAFKEV